MDGYQQYIAKSRYARYLPEEERRESWSETVERYIKFFQDRGQLSDKDADELQGAITNLEVMPSMRCLMTAGKALERDNVAGFNCFAGEEGFITDEGLRTFQDSVGETVKVLAGDGVWREAEVRTFGTQPIQEITLRHSKKSNLKTTIKVTPNHRWIVDGKETTELKIGDKVISTPFEEEFDFNLEAWIAGFGFGDGTLDTRGRARVRLCGDKNTQWLPYFEEYGNSSICYPPSCEGDAIVIFHKGHFSDWKELPYRNVRDLEWMKSWLDGYLAADGHNNPRQPGLSSQDKEALDFVQKYAPYVGLVITGRNTLSSTTTNYGERKAPLGRLTIRDSTTFYVENIKPLGTAPVYCAVEPVTQSFTLACGALTGNCSYLPIDSPRAFDELMYILLCGTGVGYSVERQYVNQLPTVAEEFHETDTVIAVADSKIGWAKSFRELVSLLYAGQVPGWDVSRVRPAGAVLQTFGGRASGPEPLEELFNFTVSLFKRSAGRSLTSIECHDLCCKIAQIVVVGGVRRSALISLSNLTDDRLRRAKSGDFGTEHPERYLANNSVCYTEKPDFEAFLNEWQSLYESKSGERGMFSRVASQRQAGKNGRRDTDHDFGTNPCSEIILRPNQFCNLSEVVIRAEDTLEDLKRKVRLATICGTLQASLTDFRYLRRIWKKNTEEESLLGVSFTGIMDHAIMGGKSDTIDCDVPVLECWLEELKGVAIDTNKKYAKKLGINASTAITCVKPSGTVSQLVNSASGIHPRFADYYMRTVRADAKDPLCEVLKDAGVPWEEAIGNPSTLVFSFPQKAPEGATTVSDVSAMEQLRLWKVYQDHWCEHKPSVTVYYKDEEFLEIGQWLYNNFDDVSGISFLPYSDHVYQQAPYQPLTEEEYNEAMEGFPQVFNWNISEATDVTEGAQELACSSATGCEI